MKAPTPGLVWPKPPFKMTLALAVVILLDATLSVIALIYAAPIVYAFCVGLTTALSATH